MRNTLNSVFIFAAGAIIGSAVTWKFVRTKYERIAQEEIDSVKEVYSHRQSEPTEGDTESESKRFLKEIAEPFAEGLAEGLTGDQLSISDYAKKLQGIGYTNYSGNSRSAVEPEQKVDKDVATTYVIDPDEFGEQEGYGTAYLTYYADSVLAYDDNDEIIEDVGSIVGDDFSEHFGDFEENVVHIRNDDERYYYEITKDLRNYTDVVNKGPHRAEDEWDEMK